MKHKYLILENDSEIDERFQEYLDSEGIQKECVILGMTSQRSSEEVAEYFSKVEVVLFQPNLINFGQYNLMLMLMYDLIQKNKLSVKTVKIFTHKDIESELKELWEGKDKYLKEVLKHVKIFSIDPSEYTEQKLMLI